jgi:hypothetical protein
VLEAALLVLGGFALSRTLGEASGWMAVAAWFCYLVLFGIVGMRLAHRIGVRSPNDGRRGAPDV